MLVVTEELTVCDTHIYPVFHHAVRIPINASEAAPEQKIIMCRPAIDGLESNALLV